MPSVLHEIEAYGKLGALYSLQPGSWCVQVFETAESRARERGVSPHDFVWAYIGHNKANAYRHLKQYGPARKTCCAALEILKNGLEEVKNSETMYSAVEQTMHLFATVGALRVFLFFFYFFLVSWCSLWGGSYITQTTS